MSRLFGWVSALVFALGALGALGSPARAQEAPPRTVILWIDGVTLADLRSQDGFDRLLLQGAVATLATQPVDPTADPITALAAAADALGDGRQVRRAATRDRFTAFGAAVAVYGLVTRVVGGMPDGSPSAVRAFGPASRFPEQRFARDDHQFPGSTRTDIRALTRALPEAIETSTILLVHLPDVLLAERALSPGDPARASWVSLTMRRADELLATICEKLSERDRLMVVSPTASGPRRERGIALGVAVLHTGACGPGIGPDGDTGPETGPETGPDAEPSSIRLADPKLLRSKTTLRNGFVSITDVAPTILSLYGISRDDVDRVVFPRLSDPPPGFAGHPMDVVSRADAVERAQRLEFDLIDAARAHRPVTRLFALVALALIGLATLTILAGRGRPPPGGPVPHARPARGARAPRGWRDALATGLIAIAFLPAAALMEVAFSARGVVRPLLVGSIAVAVALGLRATTPHSRAVAIALTGSAFVVLADLMAGGGLAARATLPLPIAHGGHARAFDAVLLGVIVGGLAGAGVLLDRARQSDTMPLGILAAGGIAVAAVGTSGAGGDVGAAIALTPAVLLLALVAAGARITRHATAGMVAATIATAGLLTLTYGPTLWVNQDPLVPMRGIPEIAGMRWDLFVEQLTGVWVGALLVPAVIAVLLLARRRALVGRGLWGMPHLRAALLGVAVFPPLAVLTVNGGLATAGVTAVLSATAALVPMLAPD